MASDLEDGADASGSAERRSNKRRGVIKRANIIFNDSIVDCLLVDVSDTGARVRLASVVPIPAQVTLRFTEGAMFLASLRWTRGHEVGFLFEGPASLPQEASRLAWRVFDIVRKISVAEPMRLLSSANFFGDIALHRAAEEAEASLRRLEEELAVRARTPLG